MAGESKIKTKALKNARAFGWLPILLLKSSIRGWPDTILVREGRTVWAEYKDDGKEPSAQQQIRINELRLAGAEVYVFDSIEASDRVLCVRLR